MGKLTKNQRGFAAIEAVLILVIVALVVGTGIYVYHAKHNADKTLNAASSASSTTASTKTTTKSSPYAGWKTYTLKKEKLSFQYPASWQLKDTSDSENDNVTLTGTNGFVMTIGAGAAVSAVNVGSGPIGQATVVTFAGRTAYLDDIITGGAKTRPVYEITMSRTASAASDFFATKNIAFNAANSRILVKMDYWGANDDTSRTEPLSYVQNDVNFKNAKLVVDSMSYRQ